MPKPKAVPEFWVVGKTYYVRTVTHDVIGELAAVEGPNQSELIFKHAAWIPYSQKIANRSQPDMADWLSDYDTMMDNQPRAHGVEPYPDDELVLVNRAAITDACRRQDKTPQEQPKETPSK
jgi:hypothetical protein